MEERFRRRYVDLIMNDDARRIAITRPKIIRAIQQYLDGQGLIEVETPVLEYHSWRCGSPSVCNASQYARHSICICVLLLS